MRSPTKIQKNFTKGWNLNDYSSKNIICEPVIEKGNEDFIQDSEFSIKNSEVQDLKLISREEQNSKISKKSRFLSKNTTQNFIGLF